MVRPRSRMLKLRGYHFPGRDRRLVAAATRLHVLLQLLQCFINALTMRDSDSLVIANQCRQRNRFRRTGQARTQLSARRNRFLWRHWLAMTSESESVIVRAVMKH